MVSKLIISLVLGCALLGGYASMYTSFRHGYFDALRACTAQAPPFRDEPCILDMSDSITKSLTGIAALDDPINMLLEFFSQGLRSNPDVKGLDLEALLAFVYLATQFGGAWFIIALEGLRVGNKGTILSWTGTFGIVFQAVTITIIAPVYLTLQLLSSPSTPQLESLLADPYDLALLPFSAIVTYIVPTVGLCLPLLKLGSGDVKHLAVALWQPFPLYHSAVRGLTRLLCGKKTSTSNGATSQTSLTATRKALSRANWVITIIAIGVHWAVLGTIIVSTTTDLISLVDGNHILALTSLTEPPTLAMFNSTVSITDSREIVVSFLRWDVYCTCLSMLVWSVYQLHSMRGSPGVLSTVVKAAFYILVGGPIFPSLMFVWERDERVLKTLELERRKERNGKARLKVRY